MFHRLRALDDEQILFASWCVRGAAKPGKLTQVSELLALSRGHQE